MKSTDTLCLRLTKRADGRAVLRCERADGTMAWQRHEGKHAQFFPVHDLTHFAVETALDLTRGFYGLLAEGWDFRDLTGKGTRGKLPPESVLIENIVGLFERERVGAGARALSADEFNAQLSAIARASGTENPFSFSDDQLAETRRRIDALHAQWSALAPGASLDLEFA